jgi:L-threonylcarbamoyladenylate synthase
MRPNLQIIEAKEIFEEREKYKKVIGDIIAQGSIIAFPTDTVYGLAVDAFNENALQKLYKIKKRSFDKPCVVQISDKSELKDIVGKTSPSVQKLIDRFWPGVLTIIFSSKYKFSKIICGENLTVGIRIPQNDIALHILSSYKNPLAVTSANVSGQEILNNAEDISEEFKDSVDFIIKDRIEGENIPSTVIDVTSEPARILREGTISKDELEKVIKVAVV